MGMAVVIVLVVGVMMGVMRRAVGRGRYDAHGMVVVVLLLLLVVMGNGRRMVGSADG